MSEHTELPWCEGTYWWDILGPVDEPVAQVEDVNSPAARANAEFIVRAANAHYGLLKSLEEIMAWGPKMPDGMKQRALDAIAKATEPS